MKHQSYVGADLAEGASFSIFCLTELKNVGLIPFDNSVAIIEQFPHIRKWWKFSVTNRIDCVAFLIGLAINADEINANHFDNVAGEINLQPEDLFHFLRNKDMVWGMDGDMHYVHITDENEFMNLNHLITFGNTLFEAILEYYRSCLNIGRKCDYTPLYDITCTHFPNCKCSDPYHCKIH